MQTVAVIPGQNTVVHFDVLKSREHTVTVTYPFWHQNKDVEKCGANAFKIGPFLLNRSLN